jgi:hypothetical protein
MSVINVTITNAGSANVSVSNGSTVNATVGNGGAVNVSTGTISPGNATVVSGTLTINSTTTLAAGQSAYVKNDAGTAFAAKLDIGIPAGPATVVSVGNTTTLAAGSNATVNGTTSGSNLTLSFGIPSGTPGQNGINGIDGTNGINGITPTFTASASTLSAGSNATVTATTSNNGANVALAFGIPQGAAGSGGGSNLTLSDATPSNLGTAAAGSSNLAARADHVHSLPSLSTLGAAAAAHNHPYVTSLNNLTGGLTLAAGGNVTISSANSTLTIAASGGGLGANDAVDGGDYVGEILLGITFATQPQSQTLNGSATLTLSDVANGTKLRALSGTIGDVGGLNGTLYAQRISGNKAGLVYSTDNGSTWDWTNITQSNSTAAYQFGQYLIGTVNGSQTAVNVSLSPEMFFASNGTRTLVVTAIADNVAGFSDPGQRGMSWVYSAGATPSLSNAVVTDQQFQTLCYLQSAGRWAATGLYGNIFTSSDGTNWTQRDSAISATIQDLGYFGKRVYAINGRFVTWQGTGILQQLHSWYSTDGATWVPTPIAFGITTEAASSTRIVGISTESTNTVTVVRVTTDGQSWQQVTLPVKCTSIRYGAGLFWAFPGASSTDVLTSADGVTWTVRADSSSAVKAGGGGVAAAAFFPRAGGTILGATVGGGALSANLTVAATSGSGAAVAYQWQASIDAGTTWSNVTNATATTLSLVNLTQADSGTRYRAFASATGAASVASQSATLTVTG